MSYLCRNFSSGTRLHFWCERCCSSSLGVTLLQVVLAGHHFALQFYHQEENKSPLSMVGSSLYDLVGAYKPLYVLPTLDT